MFVLDTNHFRELGYQSLLGQKLQSRLNECAEDVFITVVSVTESVKGRLAQVSAARRLEDEINAYRQVSLVVRHLAAFTHLPWDAEAAARFKAFRQQGIRIGTMDLKIAASFWSMTPGCSHETQVTSPKCRGSVLKTGWTDRVRRKRHLR